MIAVLRNRNFRLLWLGGLISMNGNWVLLAALPFHVYAITGSALATSGLLMAYIAPGIVFSSLAGVFVDRWDRRRTMYLVSLAQGLILLSLLLVQSVEMVWLIYVALFIESTLGQFFSPAENALLPTLVEEDKLMAANSLNSMNDNLARLAGPALGGAMLGLLGFSSVIIIDALTYFLAAALIFMVGSPAGRPLTEAAAASGDQAAGNWLTLVWREWISGLRLVASDRLLRALFLIMGIAMLGDAIISAVLVVFVQDDMGLNAIQFGWLMTARGIGGLLGALLLAQMASRLKPILLISLGLIGSGLLVLLTVRFPELVVVLPLLALVGIVVMAWIITVYTLLQQGAEDRFRGRVFGAFGTTTTLLMFIGNGLGGFLADELGGTTLMISAAFIFIAAGLLALPLLAGQRLATTLPDQGRVESDAVGAAPLSAGQSSD